MRGTGEKICKKKSILAVDFLIKKKNEMNRMNSFLIIKCSVSKLKTVKQLDILLHQIISPEPLHPILASVD